MTNNSNRGIINLRANHTTQDKTGVTDGMTKLIGVKPIDFSDKAAISKEIEDFARRYAYADVEYALEISPNGNAYILKGFKGNVDSGILGKDILKNSISIHNHIVPKAKFIGDSFSRQDLGFAAEYKLGRQYLVSGERRNAFEYIGNLTRGEIEKKYDEAFTEVRSIALETGIYIYAEEQQVMEKLNEILEGFTFYGRF